ncbi:MAG: type III pantothenate kinase [Luteimonas sp.]|nr:type III pantothenate kinase [Luteimonas sp.]
MADWLFDLGNSRLKFAPMHDDGNVGDVFAVAHDGERFASLALEALPASITHAHVASVAAAPLRESLLATLHARGAAVALAATERRCAGVEVAYEEPGQLGVDRFLALLAAHARGGDRLVVGVGTALTIDLVDRDGSHHGGRIAPSPTLMRETLHARASQLPSTGGDYREFAGDTADALASGCIGAALALVERSLREAGRRLGHPAGLLLHGGGAGELAPHFPHAVQAPGLVLEGLACWARERRDR